MLSLRLERAADMIVGIYSRNQDTLRHHDQQVYTIETFCSKINPSTPKVPEHTIWLNFIE